MQSIISLRQFVPDLDPTQYKLHCAVWNQKDNPLDVYVRSWDEWIGWNMWRPATDQFNRPFIFSLMQFYHEPNTWLFGGVFEVVGRRQVPNSFAYKIELRENVLPGCIGRLKVKYRHPGRSIRLRLEGALDQIEVVEILKNRYTGSEFPGHDSINVSLSELEAIYAQQRTDWRVALEHMKGVYVIHDCKSGKPYVGSAYGDTGIWERWGQYVEKPHGGNIDLMALMDSKGEAYCRDNLMFALLEYWSMRVEDEYVKEREGYWKRVLLSRLYGHNKN